MERHIFTVTEVNELVKLLLDQEPIGAKYPTIKCIRRDITIFP